MRISRTDSIRQSDARGASLVEYVLLLAAISVGAVFALTSTGGGVEASIGDAADGLGGQPIDLVDDEHDHGATTTVGSGGGGSPATTTTVDSGGSGGSNKVVVCHRTGAGGWNRLEIAQAAVSAHMDHGDGSPGGTVPGSTDTFDDDCNVVPGATTTTVTPVVAPTSVDDWAAGGPGSHPVSSLSFGGYTWDSSSTHSWLDWNTNADRYEVVQEGLAAQLNIAAGVDYSCTGSLLAEIDTAVNNMFSSSSWSNSEMTSLLGQIQPYNTGAATC